MLTQVLAIHLLSLPDHCDDDCDHCDDDCDDCDDCAHTGARRSSFNVL